MKKTETQNKMKSSVLEFEYLVQGPHCNGSVADGPVSVHLRRREEAIPQAHDAERWRGTGWNL